MASADMHVTVTVDQRQLEDLCRLLEDRLAEQAAQTSALGAAAIAGCLLAGSRRRVSRRRLLTFWRGDL
jgi:hypothetical protein